MKVYIVLDLPNMEGFTEEVATSLNIKFEDLDGNPKNFGHKEWTVYDHLEGRLYNSITDAELDKTQFSFD